MNDLQTKINALTEEQLLVKQALADATKALNFQAVARLATRLAEIESRLEPLNAHLSSTELNPDEQELIRAEEAARQARVELDVASAARDEQRKKLENEVFVKLAPFQRACDAAFSAKRSAEAKANEARGRLSQARRAAVEHFAAHGL